MKARIVGSAAVLACLLGLAIAWWARKPEPAKLPGRYPVRWTSHVKLKSLGDIDSLLDKPVDMYADEKAASLVLTSPDGKTRREVRTPREYLGLLDKGYYAFTTIDMTMESWFIVASMPITHLKRARPSQKSFVSAFRLSDDPLKHLPPTLGSFGDDFESAQEAAKSGKTWKDLYPQTKVRVIDQHQVEMSDECMKHRIELVAWGDFNIDGVEDLLVHVCDYAVGGTFRSYGYVVLTRFTADSRLTVIDLPGK